jgi:subtilisin-like proprotein convertase family protein
MGAFMGEDPNGTWTLTVSDGAPGNSGMLQSWSLEISSLSASPTSSLLISGDGSSFPIPDDGTPLVLTTVVPPLYSAVCGLTALTNIQHPSPGDLVATLTSPAGTVVTLTSGNGGSHPGVFNGTIWDDLAQTPVTDYVFSDGVLAATLQPQGAMGAFVGENPAGTWTLTITDQSPGGAGTLNGWQMTTKGCTCNTALAAAPVRVDEHPGPGVVSNMNGVFETGESVLVEKSWTNPGATPFFLEGLAQNFAGPAGPAYAILDAGATYGTIAPLGVGNCHDDGTSCFTLQITGARPLQHWDATFDEHAQLLAAPSGDAPPPSHTWTLHVGESFPDVLVSNIFYRYVETIFHKGVTGGCATPPDYCPADPALRKQMAVFVLKSKEGSAYTPPPAVGIFNDVPASDPFAPWIEELFHRGVVAGCSAPGGPNYCPNDPVLRQQMAVFLLRTLLGSSYVPPACHGIFGDVLCPSLFADWIEDLSGRGIAAGCGGGNFCPTNPNTRGQMAPFLTKTFGLALYGP